MIHSKRHYVYVIVDPRDNVVFYVGIGQGRRNQSTVTDCHNKEKWKRITAIRQDGYEPIVDVIENRLDRHEARLIESMCIEQFGTIKHGDGFLTNLNRGGKDVQKEAHALLSSVV